MAVAVLMYHRVGDPVPGFERWTVSPVTFAGHLDALVAEGFDTLTFDELLQRRRAGRSLPDRAAVITVDDGLADFAESAWPLLAARGIRPTLFVTAGYVGGVSAWLGEGPAGRMPMIDETTLATIAGQGVEIGAHSLSHPMLDLLSLSDVERELRRSRDLLREMTNQPVDTFAYPHGYSGARVRQLAASVGYRGAAAVRHALSPAGDDLYEVARVIVEPHWNGDRLAAAMRGRGLRPQRFRRPKEHLWRVRRLPLRRKSRALTAAV